tara:strand:+ start:5339 stop:5677 length:339 start_codon:yes stop_codon:yes gene_type:complete
MKITIARVKEIIKEEYQKMREHDDMESDYDPDEPQIYASGIGGLGQDAMALIAEYVKPMVDNMAEGNFEDNLFPMKNHTIAEILLGVIAYQKELEKKRPDSVHEVKNEKKRT